MFDLTRSVLTTRNSSFFEIKDFKILATHPSNDLEGRKVSAGGTSIDTDSFRLFFIDLSDPSLRLDLCMCVCVCVINRVT